MFSKPSPPHPAPPLPRPLPPRRAARHRRIQATIRAVLGGQAVLGRLKDLLLDALDDPIPSQAAAPVLDRDELAGLLTGEGVSDE